MLRTAAHGDVNLTPFATRAIGSSVGYEGRGPSALIGLLIGGSITSEELKSAQKVTLEIKLSPNSAKSLRIGLGNTTGKWFFDEAAPDIAGKTGTLTYDLKPGQFFAFVDAISVRGAQGATYFQDFHFLAGGSVTLYR